MHLVLILATFLAAAVANPVAQPEGAKRDLVKRSTCPANGAVATPYPTGAGPVPTPNSPKDFTAYSVFAASATNAPAISGYSKAFVNLHASTQGDSYLTFSQMNSYDVTACASNCNAVADCKAFNIYFERDPVNSCPNPAGTTFIKCALYGASISKDTATNTGQTIQKFQVVVAGSDGYNRIV